ncbi:MAG: hypothetical protein HOC23_24975 [Halieaceae bacterium]|jgi:hypothetical protein|nr:hypothetical protein [Halieaceae bacterium]
MPKRTPLTAVCRALVIGMVLAAFPVVEAQAQKPRIAKQQQTMTAQQAAAKARALRGGKVLKVSRKGKGYAVRLLQDSGRVVTVIIKE